jgi:hypothetical protein
MGKIAYDSYWRTTIFEYLHKRHGDLESMSAMEIAKSTGIVVQNVVDVLKDLGFLSAASGEVFAKNNLIWTIDWDMVEKHWNSARRSDRRIWLDESKLKWTPKTYTPNTDFFLRSPLRSPNFGSPQKLRHLSTFQNLRVSVGGYKFLAYNSSST